MVGAFACIADKGNPAQLVLHHPFEIAVQESIDEENVESSLVVGHKHIALSGLEVFTSFHFYGQEEQSDDTARPVAAGVIAPEMTIAQHAPHHGDDGGKQRRW